MRKNSKNSCFVFFKKNKRGGVEGEPPLQLGGLILAAIFIIVLTIVIVTFGRGIFSNQKDQGSIESLYVLAEKAQGLADDPATFAAHDFVPYYISPDLILVGFDKDWDEEIKGKNGIFTPPCVAPGRFKKPDKCFNKDMNDFEACLCLFRVEGYVAKDVVDCKKIKGDVRFLTSEDFYPIVTIGDIRTREDSNNMYASIRTEIPTIDIEYGYFMAYGKQKKECKEPFAPVNLYLDKFQEPTSDEIYIYVNYGFEEPPDPNIYDKSLFALFDRYKTMFDAYGKKTPDVYEKKIKDAIIANDKDKAFKNYEEFIKYYPNEKLEEDTQFKVMKFYSDERKYDETAKAAKKFIEDHPGDEADDALYYLAKANINLHNHQEAYENYLEYVDKYSGGIHYTELEGDVKEAKSLKESGAPTFKDIVDTDPKDTVYHYELSYPNGKAYKYDVFNNLVTPSASSVTLSMLEGGDWVEKFLNGQDYKVTAFVLTQIMNDIEATNNFNEGGIDDEINRKVVWPKAS